MKNVSLCHLPDYIPDRFVTYLRLLQKHDTERAKSFENLTFYYNCLPKHTEAHIVGLR